MTSSPSEPTPKVMSYPAHFRALMGLGWPIAAGHLGQVAIGMTDAAMVGWYGVTELAAMTLGAGYMFFFVLVGGGFAWAVMPLVATYAAQDDETSLRRATRMGMWLSMVFALLVLPLLLFAEPMLLAAGQEPEVAAGAGTYLTIAAWGLFPALAIMVIKSYLAALEITRPILWIILASAVLNAALNWALIFGNWGAPELGLRGAAWASVGTQMAALIAAMIYAVWRLPEHRIFQRAWRVDGPMMRRVFALGWPIGLTTASEAGLFFASTFMVGRIGETALAAHGIVLQVASATFVIHMGLSNAATVRAGNALGRADRAHLARGAMIASLTSLLFAALTVVVFLTVPDVIIRQFMDADDPALPAVMSVGIGLMAAAALFQVADGAQVVALGLLRGVQDTRVPMWMAALAYWGIGMPASYVLGFPLGLGAFGIWLGLVVGLAVAAILLMWRFWRHALDKAFSASREI